jgi:hypothetical protein
MLNRFADVQLSRSLHRCWDWWGYTEPNLYGVKAGVQPSFVRRLITAVTGA